MIIGKPVVFASCQVMASWSWHSSNTLHNTCTSANVHLVLGGQGAPQPIFPVFRLSILAPQAHDADSDGPRFLTSW